MAHQLHGALRVILEHQLRLFTTRVWAWRAEFGNHHSWDAQVVTLAVASGQNGLRGLSTDSTRPSPATGKPVHRRLDLRTGSGRGLRPGLKVEHRVQPAGLRYPDRVLDVQRQIWVQLGIALGKLKGRMHRIFLYTKHKAAG